MQPELVLSDRTNASSDLSVAVIGGGLAGMSAAIEARRRGARVVIFDKIKRLGGRVASYEFGQSKVRLDLCERVLPPTSPTLDNFHRALGVGDYFEVVATVSAKSHDSGKRSALDYFNLAPNALLPAQIRVIRQILNSSYLSWKDSWNLLKTCSKLALEPDVKSTSNELYAVVDSIAARQCAEQRARKREGVELTETFTTALKNSGASDSSIASFWRPLSLFAASESPELAAYQAMMKLALSLSSPDSNFFSATLPNRSLSEIYNEKAQETFHSLGVETRFFRKIDGFVLEMNDDDCVTENEAITISPPSDRNISVVGISHQGETELFDKFVLATDPFEARALLNRSHLKDLADSIKVEDYEFAAITTVHLWLDKPLTSARSVILDGAPCQRLLSRETPTLPLPNPTSGEAEGYYYQAHIRGSHRILDDVEILARGSRDLVARVWNQLTTSFNVSESSAPRILASRVTTVLDAIISPTPRFYRSRPSQVTPFPNVALAGAWTETGLPPNMESAVLSGKLAVQAILGK